VVVCVPTTHWIGFLNAIARAVVMASLWIMLAALIAVYFISERVSSPLRDMRRAAKEFAGGNFERRVVVHGKDEIAELGIAFNQMAQSLENLEKLRGGFMASVSHELRTPMTTIAGFVDAIRDGVIPPEKQDHYLGVISTEVHRLARLVSSLLDVSRIQAGERKFVKKPFDICEMGRQIIISLEQRIEEKQLQLEFVCDEENMLVSADHDAIYQVFYNICENAVKFSSEGGAFVVTVSRLPDKKHKLQVSVYNQGAGIAAEDLPFVFERFYKGDKSRGLDRNGVGLGLYICKTIIAAHGEDIWASSAQGKDCKFSFTLTEEDLPRI
ncbi:MAG: HAMP domain-containing histidine kinase, partial [Clostridia bacterium]|nr:HAMP domain-containing histidine kinase [Clostridia bacterium]